jgi:hypothetical protein
MMKKRFFNWAGLVALMILAAPAQGVEVIPNPDTPLVRAIREHASAAFLDVVAQRTAVSLGLGTLYLIRNHNVETIQVQFIAPRPGGWASRTLEMSAGTDPAQVSDLLRQEAESHAQYILKSRQRGFLSIDERRRATGSTQGRVLSFDRHSVAAEQSFGRDRGVFSVVEHSLVSESGAIAVAVTAQTRAIGESDASPASTPHSTSPRTTAALDRAKPMRPTECQSRWFHLSSLAEESVSAPSAAPVDSGDGLFEGLG